MGREVVTMHRRGLQCSQHTNPMMFESNSKKRETRAWPHEVGGSKVRKRERGGGVRNSTEGFPNSIHK